MIHCTVAEFSAQNLAVLHSEGPLSAAFISVLPAEETFNGNTKETSERRDGMHKYGSSHEYTLSS